ncbi:miz zinc finger domain-containing protein [Cyclospora cayetanensis]|uniref:Miz zinc finger domain-containing protein n=1 Tax=Cyclospora cayetanensis TaxID=88456 RepID=A0A1D3D833_9EIME|nr:miz zinc finger domain-containing protein [Cyclospora cayetanensis]
MGNSHSETASPLSSSDSQVGELDAHDYDASADPDATAAASLPNAPLHQQPHQFPENEFFDVCSDFEDTPASPHGPPPVLRDLMNATLFGKEAPPCCHYKRYRCLGSGIGSSISSSHVCPLGMRRKKRRLLQQLQKQQRQQEETQTSARDACASKLLKEGTCSDLDSCSTSHRAPFGISRRSSTNPPHLRTLTSYPPRRGAAECRAALSFMPPSTTEVSTAGGAISTTRRSSSRPILSFPNAAFVAHSATQPLQEGVPRHASRQRSLLEALPLLPLQQRAAVLSEAAYIAIPGVQSILREDKVEAFCLCNILTDTEKSSLTAPAASRHDPSTEVVWISTVVPLSLAAASPSATSLGTQETAAETIFGREEALLPASSLLAVASGHGSRNSGLREDVRVLRGSPLKPSQPSEASREASDRAAAPSAAPAEALASKDNLRRMHDKLLVTLHIDDQTPMFRVPLSAFPTGSPYTISAVVEEPLQKTVLLAVAATRQLSESQILKAIQMLRTLHPSRGRAYLQCVFEREEKQQLRLQQRSNKGQVGTRLTQLPASTSSSKVPLSSAAHLGIEDATSPFKRFSIASAEEGTSRQMLLPARSVWCMHASCFDLESFLSTAFRGRQVCGEKSSSGVVGRHEPPETSSVFSAEISESWRCPLCAAPALPHELYVCGFVLQLLEQHPKDTASVVFADAELLLPVPHRTLKKRRGASLL